MNVHSNQLYSRIKTPRELRDELEKAQGRLRSLIGLLGQNVGEKRWGLGDECKRVSDQLESLLASHTVPPSYRVAVVGRFKAGKSSFVNELLGQRLAGEDTSPETAAITIFNTGPKVLARVKLIDKETWAGIKGLYEKDQADPEAHRAANWFKFSREKRQTTSNSAQPEVFDLDSIEKEHIRADGHVLEIELERPNNLEAQRKAENDFRRKLRRYTSGSQPYHCLVKSIEIESPSQILAEGITLVDTPGLDDTERFRVQLTERAVENIDAILFLTKSGAAYGHSEKEFLLSLLRKGSVKQLVFVVTQVDQTYDQHIRQCRDQDEDPEPIRARIDAEARRVRQAIEETFDEVSKELGSAAVQRFKEQIDAVEIAFTSAANHRDWVQKDPVKYPINQSDPGGIISTKKTLFKILSTESRLVSVKQSLRAGATAALEDMLSVIENRRKTVNNLRSREVAESKLSTFRAQFSEVSAKFEADVRSDSTALSSSLMMRSSVGSLVAENVALLADEVLRSYEVDDAGRHWKTRRSGYWGYMHNLQARVANKIFPKVSSHLALQTADFGAFVDQFRVRIATMAEAATRISETLEIGGDIRLDITETLDTFLTESLQSAQEVIEGEENRIISLLDEFIDESVEERISTARDKVGNIFGRGTTLNQSEEVRSFYREVRSILRKAIEEHVRSRFEQFGEHLQGRAGSLPIRAVSQISTQLERASADIRIAAETSVTGQKEAFHRLAVALSEQASKIKDDVLQLLGDETDSRQPDGDAVSDTADGRLVTEAPIGSLDPMSIAVFSENLAWIDSVSDQSKKLLERFTLRNGETGWPFNRILAPRFLTGAYTACLVDPYLEKPFQRRNLTEFALALMSVGKLKCLYVATRPSESGLNDLTDAFFDSLDKDCFQAVGMKVVKIFSSDLHDRSLVLDNGILFKFGRGLDIYKPAAGLATRDLSLRKVRACEIDVFGPDHEA